ERHPRQVVLERELVQVDAVHPRQPEQDEGARRAPEGAVQTPDLGVKGGAVPSALAAEDDEDRLAALAGRGPGGGQVVDEPARPGRGRGALQVGAEEGQRQQGGGRIRARVHENPSTNGQRGFTTKTPRTPRRRRPRERRPGFVLFLSSSCSLW